MARSLAQEVGGPYSGGKECNCTHLMGDGKGEGHDQNESQDAECCLCGDDGEKRMYCAYGIRRMRRAADPQPQGNDKSERQVGHKTMIELNGCHVFKEV